MQTSLTPEGAGLQRPGAQRDALQRKAPASRQNLRAAHRSHKSNTRRALRPTTIVPTTWGRSTPNRKEHSSRGNGYEKTARSYDWINSC